jgi:hypothetical protein
MRGVRVCVGIDRNRPQPQRARRARDPAGDFAAIGDQEGPKHSHLTAILDASRRNNRRHGATGIPLRINRGFLLVPESSKAAVKEAFPHISRDVIDNAVPAEQAARIAGLLRNFYRVDAGSCAA